MKTLLTTLTALLVFGGVSAGEFDMKCFKVIVDPDIKMGSIRRCESKEIICYVYSGYSEDGMSCKFKKEEK